MRRKRTAPAAIGGMVAARKAVAADNGERVRVALQSLHLRGVPPAQITVKRVAQEAGVSIATLYRRSELFADVKRANLLVQRRVAEQHQQAEIARLQQEAVQAHQDLAYQRQEMGIIQIGSRSLVEENRQLRKQKIDLQREIARLMLLLDTCTCGNSEHLH